MIRRLVLGCALLLAPEAFADDRLVFGGNPTVRIESVARGSQRTDLSDSQSQEYRLLILKRGAKYVWASRGERELIYSKSGAYHFFVEPGGAGYIKVEDPSLLGLQTGSTGLLYIETMNLRLGTITYWGSANGISP